MSSLLQRSQVGALPSHWVTSSATAFYKVTHARLLPQVGLGSSRTFALVCLQVSQAMNALGRLVSGRSVLSMLLIRPWNVSQQEDAAQSFHLSLPPGYGRDTRRRLRAQWLVMVTAPSSPGFSPGPGDAWIWVAG